MICVRAEIGDNTFRSGSEDEANEQSKISGSKKSTNLTDFITHLQCRSLSQASIGLLHTMHK